MTDEVEGFHLVGRYEVGTGTSAHTGDPVVTIDLWAHDIDAPGHFAFTPGDAVDLGVSLASRRKPGPLGERAGGRPRCAGARAEGRGSACRGGTLTHRRGVVLRGTGGQDRPLRLATDRGLRPRRGRLMPVGSWQRCECGEMALHVVFGERLCCRCMDGVLQAVVRAMNPACVVFDRARPPDDERRATP